MTPTDTLDLTAVKRGQQAMWASGDYGTIAAMIQVVAERLVDEVNPAAGSSVLDVAGGTGNAAIAAARSNCHVTCTDYVPELLERGRERARAERLDIAFELADAEALPYADGAYDAVLSVFGAMFAPDQPRTAAELARVCRPGGKIGLANWTPEGFVGQLFKTIGGHVPPPPGARSPALWGTRSRLAELFEPHAASIRSAQRHFVFRYRSPEHWLEVFRTYYGPVLKAFAALEPPARPALERDLLDLIGRFDRSGDRSMVVPSEYLEVVVTRH
jgi:ubiquinone/menaquinone biosynthesis C-methylase UbiE